nr:hypothetical protein [Tanacetum cinerariifolium]
MAPLTFADTHNMIAFLSKSDASARFDQIVDFLNTQVIHYALMVNPTIYVSCIKQFWVTTLIKKVNDVIKLQALIDRKKVVVTEDIIRQDLQLDDPDAAAEEEDEEDEVPAAPTLPSPIHEPSPPPQEPITSSPQAQPAPPSSPPQEQHIDTYMTLLHTLMETCVTLSKKLLLTYQNLPFEWSRLIKEQ